MNPFCSVLVLNYNGRGHLPVCLSSLEKQTHRNFETILVDNASEDDSIEFVRENFPDVKIVKNSENSGTAGGFNFGAKQSSAEYLLFLANDIEAEPNLIEELMKTMQRDPSIAICSSKMLRFYERDTIDYAGFKLDVYGFPYIIGHNEKDKGQYNTVRDTIATGTCLLIKHQVLFYLAIKRGDMALAIVKTVLWNLKHLKGTLSLRWKTQKRRVVGDGAIQKEMIKKKHENRYVRAMEKRRTCYLIKG